MKMKVVWLILAAGIATAHAAPPPQHLKPNGKTLRPYTEYTLVARKSETPSTHGPYFACNSRSGQLNFTVSLGGIYTLGVITTSPIEVSQDMDTTTPVVIRKAFWASETFVFRMSPEDYKEAQPCLTKP